MVEHVCAFIRVYMPLRVRLEIKKSWVNVFAQKSSSVRAALQPPPAIPQSGKYFYTELASRIFAWSFGCVHRLRPDWLDRVTLLSLWKSDLRPRDMWPICMLHCDTAFSYTQICLHTQRLTYYREMIFNYYLSLTPKREKPDKTAVRVSSAEKNEDKT